MLVKKATRMAMLAMPPRMARLLYSTINVFWEAIGSLGGVGEEGGGALENILFIVCVNLLFSFIGE